MSGRFLHLGWLLGFVFLMLCYPFVIVCLRCRGYLEEMDGGWFRRRVKTKYIFDEIWHKISVSHFGASEPSLSSYKF